MDSIHQLSLSLHDTQAKRCAKCGGTKPVTEFHRSKASRDGFTPNCKECRSRRADPAAYKAQLANRAVGLKRCTKCGETKQLDAFSRNKLMVDGHERRCKACLSERVDKEAHAQRLANRAAGVKQCTKCGETKPFAEFSKHSGQPDGHHPRCKACWKIVGSAYYVANREALLAQSVKWQRANRDKTRAIYKKWRKTHMVQSREYVRRYRYRRKAATSVRFTHAQLIAKMEYWGHRCWMCGAPADTLDHVKPLAKGGLHVLANTRPACRSCNSAKKDRWPYKLTRNIPRW